MTQSETYSSSPCRVSSAVAAFARDDGGDASLLQPVEQPPEFRAKNADVRESSEQRLQRIQHDTLRADGVDGDAQSDEQPLEVEVAGFLDFAAHDRNVVDQQFFARAERFEIKAHRSDVLSQVVGALFE